MAVRPAKTQISLGIRPVWSESSLCAQWVAKDPSFLRADSEDSDQTGRMPGLIWAFAGRTCHTVGFVVRRLIWSLFVFGCSSAQSTILQSCRAFYKEDWGDEGNIGWTREMTRIKMRHSMTKPTKCPVRPAKTQISQTDQNLPCALSWNLTKQSFFMRTDSDQTGRTDQTGRMPRLIWAFAGRTGHFSSFVVLWLKYKNAPSSRSCCKNMMPWCRTPSYWKLRHLSTPQAIISPLDCRPDGHTLPPP